MKSFFSPAIRLMNRFNYPGRLAITGASGFLAIIILLASNVLEQLKDISQARSELAVLEVIQPLHHMVQLTQQHRGISTTFLSGETSLEEKMENRQADVEAAVRQVDVAESRHSKQFESRQEWLAIKADWESLRRDIRTLYPEENFVRHNGLIERMLRFQVTIADVGGLSLDSELHTYYLGAALTTHLPTLLERLGKMRAKGAGILARKKLTIEERVDMIVHYEQLQRNLASLNQVLGKSVRHSPGIASALGNFSADLEQGVLQSMELTVLHIFSGNPVFPAEQYFDRFTESIDVGYHEMFDTLFPMLQQLLEQRLVHLQQHVQIQIGLTLLFLLLLLYLGAGSYFTIIESVQRLSEGAERIQTGDLTTRIKLEGQDELTDVANSFNTMATAIDKLMRDSRQINSELIEALEAAKLADQAKDAFLANVSHELRTPLNAVIGLAELARRPDATLAKRMEYLMKISDAGRTLSTLINDLLDLSKIAAGRMELHPLPFRPLELAERVRSILSYRFAEKSLPLRIETDADLPEALVGDSLRIEQVLLNLLSNAAKFTHAGQVVMRLGMAGQSGENVRLRIEIEDTGIGMTQEEIARLFQPFSQADASMTRKYGGTGLGLALCKNIAELMGGAISVRSQPGQGSCFTAEFQLQVGKPEAVESQVQVLDHSAEAIRYRDTRVLAVDDQPMNREIVSEMLESTGISVRLAENGQQALDILREAGPDAFDLVLMDIQMPLLDGLEATRRLKTHEKFRKLPIIAMTAHTMEHEKQASMAVGMVDHIGKPIDSQHFFAVLARWIPVEKQQATKEAPAAPVEAAVPVVSLLDALACIDGIDAAGGLSRFGGKEDRYLKWLNEFIETGTDLPRQVDDALASGNREAAAKVVHTYKGQVGTLGFVNLHACVVELEKRLRTEGPHEAEMAAVVAEIRALRSGLQDALSRRDASTPQGKLQRLEWQESYGLGVLELDDQHKRFITLINRLDDLHASHTPFPGKAVHEILSDILDHSREHFAAEERYMRKIDYPGLADHVREHQMFIDDLAAFSLAASRGILNLAELHGYLTRWLGSHHLQSDRKFGSAGA